MTHTARGTPRPLDGIDTWVFDLDNTLYPANCGLFEQVQVRMNDYICTRLGLAMEQAIALRRRYFLEHGTTMNGLMQVDRIDPHEFLAFVHEVDLSLVPANPALVTALAALPGRKLVYTNGSVRHAQRLLEHLGISASFSGIFDIVASEFTPKPASIPFRAFVERYGIAPQSAVMVEDMAKNLVPAAALGMTTAWIRTGIDWAAPGSDADHIHYIVEDLAGFLTAATKPSAP
ncbi:MAG TPA: pyrimidine 5'-nucleotidase [Stellaceae bacterium]|jgi:putative hydrolase of the HAD superfamily|nr:pyrimidine 5'-nucleotidase [Stellaceae bacterium]